MTRVLISLAAQTDLIEIGDSIALGNPDRARSFVAEIEAKIMGLRDTHGRYPKRNELLPGLRAAT